jgi:hypothetical protein
MEKQAMRSDLIAQPSFWPELEPAEPAPQLATPKLAKPKLAKPEAGDSTSTPESMLASDGATHAAIDGARNGATDGATNSIDPLPAPSLVQLPSFRSGPADRRLPERLLILDTETTGLQSERDHCIEIGAVLFHVA